MLTQKPIFFFQKSIKPIKDTVSDPDIESSPIYHALVCVDGSVHFRGIKNVPFIGKKSYKLSPKQFNDLKTIRSDFYPLQDYGNVTNTSAITRITFVNGLNSTRCQYQNVMPSNIENAIAGLDFILNKP